MSMNTISSGSDRINDIQDHLQGEIRGQTKLVKITEDVPKYALEQGVSEEEALQKEWKKNPATSPKRAASFTPKLGKPMRVKYPT